MIGNSIEFAFSVSLTTNLLKKINSAPPMSIFEHRNQNLREVGGGGGHFIIYHVSRLFVFVQKLESHHTLPVSANAIKPAARPAACRMNERRWLPCVWEARSAQWRRRRPPRALCWCSIEHRPLLRWHHPNANAAAAWTIIYFCMAGHCIILEQCHSSP